MKYKVKIKDCMLTVRTQAWFTEHIDERVLDVFMNMHLRGFLKPKLIRKNVVEYTGPEGVSLFERMQSMISKQEFFMIMEQILLAEQKLSVGRLDIGYMVLDPHHVFINNNTHEVQFLYVPTSAPAADTDIVDFMKAILYLAKPDPRDGDYLTDFVYFLNSMSSYQPERIEQYMLALERKAIMTVRKRGMPHSSFLTSQRLKYMEHVEERQKDDGIASDSDLPETDVWQQDETCPETDVWNAGDDCPPTGLMDEEEDYSCPPTGLMDEEEDYSCPPTGLMDEEEDYSCPPTGLMDESDIQGANEIPRHRQLELAWLVRRSNDERISITNMLFRIGRGGPNVDYAVANNSRIGRSHVEFVFRGRQCYVVDLQSKNGTYINDSPIPPGAEIAIYNGDRLRLADDEFVFNQE